MIAKTKIRGGRNMLNLVSIMGRLVADPEIKTFQKGDGEKLLAIYRLAVERDYKDGDSRPVDYIYCKAWGRRASFAEKYYHKGDLVVVTGRLTTESYKREGGEKTEIFTSIQVAESYFARQRGADQNRSREISQVQDGKQVPQENSADEKKDEVEAFPPLPTDEMDDIPDYIFR